ncbi:hypothetical protein ES319_D08G096300v1 [Gossypium barbadense]|uniref:Uncharacterized protein n=2 Tax=Gossypium TaxID=3633 RepID=A0A5J5QE05_GOSBA|nr:hypothetical protein ES319_D08G096300v1 [Gossypium barbadense]TYG56921.1 hypothetical protein ES288_D08G102100v1 [Gossypium darwinii]
MIFPSFVVGYDFLVQFLALKIMWANDMELTDIDEGSCPGSYRFSGCTRKQRLPTHHSNHMVFSVLPT